MNQTLVKNSPSSLIAKPYSVSTSKLGAVTKLYTDKFICNEKAILRIHSQICEKLGTLHPSSNGLQYIVSFTDRTHFEHNDFQYLNNTINHSEKCTERLILNWAISHKIGDIPNELSVIVRLSNPVNPLLVIQAALSKSPSELDNFEFEHGSSVSVSITGATQMFAEEIFSIIGKWIEGCIQPQPFITFNRFLRKHHGKIEFLNYWLFPILCITAYFLFLKEQSIENMIPLLLLGIIGHEYLRRLASSLNSRVDRWNRTSSSFSIFDLTGGDANQQTKFIADSKNSTIKLIIANTISFILSVLAGYTVFLLTQV
ncbi:hypothetical protein [Nitrosomonas aestuarii]|uniref:hypothetical protein n=1 Tax=Nitrosomonas aestuarii TaxID=52441 RepID=UPI000D3036A3|nr:hypothetical protein [Nitrosomonas aestuarii]PTN08863.1 hypothetical protein C8R11_1251 [Nitrosomonas aestuarii]